MSAQKLVDNLKAYKKRKNEERLTVIQTLKDRIENIYIDEKLKPEKLQEYTQGLVQVLKFTSVI